MSCCAQYYQNKQAIILTSQERAATRQTRRPALLRRVPGPRAAIERALEVTDYFCKCASLTSPAIVLTLIISTCGQVQLLEANVNLRIVTGVIALFLFAGTAGLATAQETTKTTHKKTRTLTGCLQKGEDANEYNFTAKGGGTWEIKSDSVKLDEHVGHTVKITGVVSNATAHGMKEDAKGEMQEHGMDKHDTEHGHMTVTDLAMVSDSCQK